MKLVTFEITTQLGKQQRLGAMIDGDQIVDLNSAYALHLSETQGQSAAYQSADAILPSDMIQYFERGARSSKAAQASLENLDGTTHRYPRRTDCLLGRSGEPARTISASC